MREDEQRGEHVKLEDGSHPGVSSGHGNHTIAPSADNGLLVAQFGSAEHEGRTDTERLTNDVESVSQNGAQELDVELSNSGASPHGLQVTGKTDDQVEDAGDHRSVHGIRAEPSTVLGPDRIDDSTYVTRVGEIETGTHVHHAGMPIPLGFELRELFAVEVRKDTFTIHVRFSFSAPTASGKKGRRSAGPPGRRMLCIMHQASCHAY